VIYDPRQLPPLIEPAEYPRVAPKDIGRLVTRTDMTDFFIDVTENDQLGRIAHIHTQLADRSDGGTQHPDCITLAEMHWTAVDFSKTGIAVCNILTSIEQSLTTSVGRHGKMSKVPSMLTGLYGS